MDQPLDVAVSDGVAVLTMNRPDARNALSSELLAALPKAMESVDGDDAVEVVILTGADPAFCAGLDLKELGSTGGNLRGGAAGAGAPWPAMTKPVIGAINGPAITGGFELALQCDFLVASERARFGDTHTRVGVLPGWGLTVLLPQAIGVRRAKEMSLTGNFMDAAEALQFGLVNHVVSHDELLPFCRSLAADIVGNDGAAVRALLASYKKVALTTVEGGFGVEHETARSWQGRRFDPAEVERRRAAIIERGRKQTS
jgi:enoyl-CoA hydratase